MIYGTLDVSPWIQRFNRQVYAGIGAGKDVTVQIELLDLALYNAEEKQGHAKAIAEKYKRFPPDLVVAVLPAANSFVAEYGAHFAPDVPVLHVLPEKALESQLLTNDDGMLVTSSWEAATRETAELMGELFPKRRKYFLIVGARSDNLAYLDRTTEVLNDYDVELQPLVGRTPDELAKAVNAESADSLVLYITADNDRFGNRYSGPQMMSMLSHRVNVPIFSTLDTVLGHGVLGGSFTNAELYGQRSASLVRARLFSEVNNSAASPTILPTTQVSFDETVLKRFGVSQARLPANAVIVNHTTSVWEEYQDEIVFVALVIFVQSLLIVALVYSIRQRNRIERESADQARLFESVINAIQDAIIVTDPEGMIIAVNSPGFEQTFGHKPKEFKGKSIAGLFDSGIALAPMLPTVVSCLRSSGRLFPGEANIEAVPNADNQSTGLLVVVRDVSERLAREEELRQAHKMEAIGNLAGGIAHDFNNVLTAIIGNADIASDPHVDAEQRSRSLEQILVAGMRARDLIREILNFCYPGDQQSHQLINTRELLQECVGLVRASFPSSVELTMNLNEDLWPIRGNSSSLQQVVLNLCANANQAMNGVGSMEVQAHNLAMKSSTQLERVKLPAGDYVVIRFKDSGSGISPDIMSRIFEPFFTTKQRGEGTGMGLALVYRTIDEHSAYLDLSSGDDGTEFSLYFPAQRAVESVSEQKPEEEIAVDSTRHILLIDDDELVLKINKELLLRLGHEVEDYLNPIEALQAFRARPEKFDLVFTDQTMPDMDGETLARQIHSEHDVPIIICTGNRDMKQLAESESVKLLGKPYTNAELSRVIQQMLTPELN